MSAIVTHGMLGLSVAALAAAGIRTASLAAPRGLDRALAAAALACSVIVAESMALGLVGLGGNPVALSLAAAATWLAVRAGVPAPRLGAAAELAQWWRGRSAASGLLAGALAGVLAAWTAWLVRYPSLGYDTVLYHLSEAVTWAKAGSPGSVEDIVTGVPVGYYPLAHEVLMGWGLGISRGFMPATLLIPAISVLAAAAWWRLSLTLRLPGTAAASVAAAVVTLPPAFAYGSSGAALDPAALAWVGTCAALAAGSIRRPALLVPAVAAAGLAIGSKTTALPLAAVTIAAALLAGRAQVARLRGPLLAAAALALATGAFWYLRNLAEHGSPFWPYLTLPWGDPAPPSVAAGAISFLDRPAQTLERVGGRYVEQSAGMILLFAAALAAPLVARRREVCAGAALAALSLLLWLNAPLTGVSDNPGFDAGTAGAVRYLLPGAGAAAVTLGMAGRESARGRHLALVILGAVVALNLVQGFGLGFPAAPTPLPLLVGAVVGGAAAAALRRLPLPALPRVPAGAAATAGTLALAVALVPPASGYLGRHADAGAFDEGLVRWFDERRGDDRPVAISGAVHALLAGERLQRRVRLVSARASCRELEAHRRRGFVVTARVLVDLRRRGAARCYRGERAAYSDQDYLVYPPRPGAGG